jgi:thiol-disulfide isomerase/thioredoxin
MNRTLLLIVTFFVAQITFAQNAEVTTDAEGNKVIKGFVTIREIATDSSFKWFGQNMKDYTPDASAVKALKANKDSIHILAFGGTWCSDTKFILPRFYALTSAAGFLQDNVTLLGVDHNKKTVQHLSEAFKIENVPTFIVLKNGKEIGRVVEYGTHGMFDQELGEIITAAAKK